MAAAAAAAAVESKTNAGASRRATPGFENDMAEHLGQVRYRPLHLRLTVAMKPNTFSTSLA